MAVLQAILIAACAFVLVLAVLVALAACLFCFIEIVPVMLRERRHKKLLAGCHCAEHSPQGDVADE